MKKQAVLLLALAAMWQSAFAYDFSAVAPSGQTLYYNIVNGEAEVTSEDFDSMFPYLVGDVVIPSSVTYSGTTYSVTAIGDKAFSGCAYLTTMTIPNTVTSIGARAFEHCSGLTSVTIPNTVTSIGDNAFTWCRSLTSLNIPSSLISIGKGAFYGCSGVTSVTIPNSVTSIGGGLFDYCASLTSVTVDNGNSVYDSRNNCNAIIETATNTLIAGCQSSVIPNSVTSIGNSAFSSCRELTSLTIPSSVTSIGEFAFYDCTGLTSVTIPNSVTAICKSTFRDCRGLTSVTIPNSVTSIGKDAFYCCEALTSLTIGNSVTSIGSGAFGNSFNLTSVIIPNSVTSIGACAFENSHNLTSVTIGSSVAFIGERAFKDSYNLASVICLATTPPFLEIVNDGWEDRAPFSSILVPCTLTVPCGSEQAYQSSDWSNYFNTILCDEVGIDEAEEESSVHVWSAEGCIFVEGAEGREVCVYDMMGRRVSAERSVEDGERGVPVPASGVYLVRIGDLPARRVVVVR